MEKYLLLIFLVDGLIWLRSSVGKLSGGTFPQSLGETLQKFASKNPYPLVKEFLQNVAIPNSQLFGVLTMYGEVLSALAIILGSLALLLQAKDKRMVTVLVAGLLGASFLNLIFWLSSGWTSPSTESLNLLMLVLQVVGVFALVRSDRVR